MSGVGDCEGTKDGMAVVVTARHSVTSPQGLTPFQEDATLPKAPLLPALTTMYVPIEISGELMLCVLPLAE